MERLGIISDPTIAHTGASESLSPNPIKFLRSFVTFFILNKSQRSDK